MMKKLLILVVFCSPGMALAGVPDFKILTEVSRAGDPTGQDECVKNAWKAAKPSEEQNKQACAYMSASHAVMEASKERIKQRMVILMDAWMKHPVSNTDVMVGENGVEEAIAPVRDAVREAFVNTINLLSRAQRDDFNRAFMQCSRSE